MDSPVNLDYRRRLLFLLGGAVLFVVAVLAATGSLPSGLKGQFDAGAERGAQVDEDVGRQMATEETADSQRSADDPGRAPDPEWSDDSRQRKSGDMPSIDLNYYDPPNILQLKEDTEEIIKQKALENAEKAKEAEKAKKLEDLSKTTLTVSPSKLMMASAEIPASNVTIQQPFSANQYTLCADGPGDVTIANIKFVSRGSKHSSVAYLNVAGKPLSTNVSLSPGYWSGDFQTIDNYVLPGNTCVEVGLHLVSADSDAAWQQISLLDLKANAAKIQYNGTLENWPYNGSPILGTHIVFKLDKKIFITNIDDPTSKTYLAKNSDNNVLYGSYALYTPKTTKISLSSLKLSLVTKDYASIDFQIKTSPAWPYFIDSENYNPKDFASNLDNYSSSKPLNLLENNLTVKAGEDVSIPLSSDLSYGNAMVFRIFSSGGTPATPGTFSLKVTGITSDGSLENLSTLETTSVLIADKITTNASVTLQPFPYKYSKWIDSTDAQKEIDGGGGAYELFHIETNLNGAYANQVDVQSISLKFDGTFKEKLKLRFYDYGDKYKLIDTKTVSPGDVISFANFLLGPVSIRAENIAGDGKIPYHIKPKIMGFTAVLNTDVGSSKKGQPISVFINNSNESVVEPAIFPVSLGIISVGPTALHYLDSAGNGIPDAPKMVSIGALQKNKISDFTMNEACFVAQGYVQIYEVTYKHFSREKSPFADIKLNIELQNVYLKPADWTKEDSHFTPITPFSQSNQSIRCYDLVVLNPLEPVDDTWFNLVKITAKTPNGTIVPVFVKGALLEQNPVKGPHYIFNK